MVGPVLAVQQAVSARNESRESGLRLRTQGIVISRCRKASSPTSPATPGCAQVKHPLRTQYAGYTT
jgi:hypothetical protein